MNSWCVLFANLCFGSCAPESEAAGRQVALGHVLFGIHRAEAGRNDAAPLLVGCRARLQWPVSILQRLGW